MLSEIALMRLDQLCNGHQKRGIQFKQCAWCGIFLGAQECDPKYDGTISHGICDFCADDILKALEFSQNITTA